MQKEKVEVAWEKNLQKLKAEIEWWGDQQTRWFADPWQWNAPRGIWGIWGNIIWRNSGMFGYAERYLTWTSKNHRKKRIQDQRNPESKDSNLTKTKGNCGESGHPRQYSNFCQHSPCTCLKNQEFNVPSFLKSLFKVGLCETTIGPELWPLAMYLGAFEGEPWKRVEVWIILNSILNTTLPRSSKYPKYIDWDKCTRLRYQYS